MSMKFGKLIMRNSELFIRDVESSELHHVAYLPEVKVGEYATYEVNEDDDAVDLIPAAKALFNELE